MTPVLKAIEGLFHLVRSFVRSRFVFNPVFVFLQEGHLQKRPHGPLPLVFCVHAELIKKMFLLLCSSCISSSTSSLFEDTVSCQRKPTKSWPC